MTSDLIKSHAGTTLEEAYQLMRREKIKALPLVDDEGKVAGLYTFSDLKRIESSSTSVYNIDQRRQLRVAAAIGTGKDTPERLELLTKRHVDVVVIDTAHGDSKSVIELIQNIKKQFPNLDVVAGNVS